MSGLLDKVVMITGAARGTGRAHCERFADEGADVIALMSPPLPTIWSAPPPPCVTAADGAW